MAVDKKDLETAKRLFGCEGSITDYVVSLGTSVENTTMAEIDAMHKGGRAGGAPSWIGRGGGLQDDEGAERQGDRHEIQPE